MPEGLDERALRLVSISGENGIIQSELWKKLGVTSRDGSRAVRRLLGKGRINRTKVLAGGRWTYQLKESRSIRDILEIKVDRPTETDTSSGEVSKVRRWELDSVTKGRSTLDHALTTLNPLLDKLRLGNQRIKVAREAHAILRAMIESGFATGRRANALMVVAIYAACRRLSVPVHIREVSRVAWTDEETSLQRFSSLTRGYYRGLLNAGIVEVPLSNVNLQLEKVMRRIQEDPAISPYLTDEVKADAIALLGRLQHNEEDAGKDPAGVAAGVIYYVCRGKIDQDRISRVSGVTQVTVRNRYRHIKELFGKATPWPKD